MIRIIIKIYILLLCLLFIVDSLCYRSTKYFNYYVKVTIASQEAVKARSYRGVVQPRHVVPRSVVPRSNSLERNRKVTHRSAGKISNYQYAFNDEFWPDMWYFVSMKVT